jgi:glycosyltransferase involved in cell wall biosynthesis
MNTLPFVSVVVPCRNEERHIAACLESIVATDYPTELLEVLVVDGESEDRTCAIVSDAARRHSFVRLLSNPERVTPTALNIGIAAARGQVIVRMDAHARFPAAYIRAGVEVLEQTNADLAGGPVRTRPGADTHVARAIALATSHPFGVGNSRFRVSTRAGFVDTVPFGAFRRSVFERVGPFDPRLARNQDNELNSRIIASGGAIYLTPAMTAEYFSGRPCEVSGDRRRQTGAGTSPRSPSTRPPSAGGTSRPSRS